MPRRPQWTDDEPTPVYSYIRVSTAREEMISPENQRRHNERYAEANNLRIIKHVEDLDLSGREFAKRKVGWMIDRIDEGKARGVIVWQISRWGRNLLDSLSNLSRLQQAGGKLHSATEPLGEIDTPMGRFSITMMLGIAQLQSDQIRQSWIDSHDNRRRNGLPHNSRPRFGYIYDPETRRFLVDPVTGPWLAKFYEGYNSGRPLSRLAAEANAAGIRGTKGSLLTQTSLRFVLDSGFGAGLIIEGSYRSGKRKKTREYHEGAHEPVISRETWETYLSLRKEFQPARDGAPVHRLVDLLRCGSCGRRLYRVQDGFDYNWACRNSRHNSSTPCPTRVSISEKLAVARLEEWIAEQIAGDSDVQDQMRRAYAKDKATADVARFDEIITKAKRGKANLLKMRANDEITPEELREMRQEFDSDILMAEARLNEARKTEQALTLPNTAAAEALALVWDRTGDEDVINKALKQAIRHIVVGPKNVNGKARSARQRMRIVETWAQAAEDEEPPD